jgi:hypothetical protein
VGAATSRDDAIMNIVRFFSLTGGRYQYISFIFRLLHFLRLQVFLDQTGFFGAEAWLNTETYETNYFQEKQPSNLA